MSEFNKYKDKPKQVKIDGQKIDPKNLRLIILKKIF